MRIDGDLPDVRNWTTPGSPGSAYSKDNAARITPPCRIELVMLESFVCLQHRTERPKHGSWERRQSAIAKGILLSLSTPNIRCCLGQTNNLYYVRGQRHQHVTRGVCFLVESQRRIKFTLSLVCIPIRALGSAGLNMEDKKKTTTLNTTAVNRRW